MGIITAEFDEDPSLSQNSS